jgi:hypothetical protein
MDFALAARELPAPSASDSVTKVSERPRHLILLLF